MVYGAPIVKGATLKGFSFGLQTFAQLDGVCARGLWFCAWGVWGVWAFQASLAGGMRLAMTQTTYNIFMTVCGSSGSMGQQHSGVITVRTGLPSRHESEYLCSKTIKPMPATSKYCTIV